MGYYNGIDRQILENIQYTLKAILQTLEKIEKTIDKQN